MTNSLLDPKTLRQAMPRYLRGLYFNSAAASLVSSAVGEAVQDHLTQESALGPYRAAEAAAGQLADLYTCAARLLNCDEDEVAVTESHSRGWGMAVGAMRFDTGDRILVSRSEWGGNYTNLLRIARSCGAQVEFMPVDEHGAVCVQQLAEMVDARVRLISLTWLPANGGLINPAAQIGAIARAHAIPFVIDAAQAVGQLPVDVRALGCDILTAPGRKWLRGPRGTGLLYVRRSFLPQLSVRAVDHSSAPWRDGDFQVRADARCFEMSESSLALRLGLRVAIRSALAIGLEPISNRISTLADSLRTLLADIPRVQLQDLGQVRSGLVSFTVDGIEPSVVRQQLWTRGMDVAVSGMGFTPIDMHARGLTDVVRASPHLYNDEDQIAQLSAAVGDIAMARASP
jgi:cysteine desulfurase/selenocysteine lyase